MTYRGLAHGMLGIYDIFDISWFIYPNDKHGSVIESHLMNSLSIVELSCTFGGFRKTSLSRLLGHLYVVWLPCIGQAKFRALVNLYY